MDYKNIKLNNLLIVSSIVAVFINPINASNYNDNDTYYNSMKNERKIKREKDKIHKDYKYYNNNSSNLEFRKKQSKHKQWHRANAAGQKMMKPKVKKIENNEEIGNSYMDNPIIDYWDNY